MAIEAYCDIKCNFLSVSIFMVSDLKKLGEL